LGREDFIRVPSPAAKITAANLIGIPSNKKAAKPIPIAATMQIGLGPLTPS